MVEGELAWVPRFKLTWFQIVRPFLIQSLRQGLNPKPSDPIDSPDVNTTKHKQLSYAQVARGSSVTPLEMSFNL